MHVILTKKMPPMLHNSLGNPIYRSLGLSLVCTKPSKLAAISRGHLVQAPISKPVQPSSAYLQWWRSLSLTVHSSHDFTMVISPNAYSWVTISCVSFSLWLLVLQNLWDCTPLRRVWPCLLCVSQAGEDSNKTSPQPSLFNAGQTQFPQPHPAQPQMYSSPMIILVALCWTQLSTSVHFFWWRTPDWLQLS